MDMQLLAQARSAPWKSALALALFSASMALIVAAAQGDLWLDEIWSIYLAEQSKGIFDIILTKHDNNHILNTIYLSLIGTQQHLVSYRLLSIAAGIGTIILLAVLAGRRGCRGALCILTLAGVSYPLLLYFTAARGYAPAMFFATLAFLLVRLSLETPSRLKTALLWITLLLGLLSHLTFLIILLALTAHVTGDNYRRSTSVCRSFIATFRLYSQRIQHRDVT
jgi:hypothetical protein